MGWILGWGETYPGGERGSPLQYLCLKNPHRRKGTKRATVPQGCSQWTRLEAGTSHACQCLGLGLFNVVDWVPSPLAGGLDPQNTVVPGKKLKPHLGKYGRHWGFSFKH